MTLRSVMPLVAVIVPPPRLVTVPLTHWLICRYAMPGLVNPVGMASSTEM